MRMKNLLLLCLLLCHTTVLISSASALEIVYPEDKTYFQRSDFLILKGGSAPPLQGMTVDINGAKSEIIDISASEYKAAFGDFLILQPAFDPGKNEVVVDGYAGGQKVASAKATIYFLDGDPSAIPPSEFRPYVLHTPAREKLCVPCHNMNPDQAELASSDVTTHPCASCHSRMLNHSHVHGPAGVFRCVDCHDPASKPNKYQVRAKGAELCMECHLEKMRKFNENKYVHGPVGAGLCLVCHNAHASEFPAQLHAKTNVICLGCHDKVKKEVHVGRGVGGKGHPLEDVMDPTNPGRELSCASCHDPHGGQASALFRRNITSRFALCQICHLK